ncbi:MAG: hypothetical protein AAF206_07220 [Bacteroidota bacterium]
MKKGFHIVRMLMLCALAAMVVTACNPDEPEEGEEEIDTVILTFDNGGPTVTWTEGEATPTITLSASTTYNVTAEFRNVAENENVTTEIQEEDDEHLVCFEVSGGANVVIAATDSDGTYPIGLASEWVAGDASTGTMILKLRHQPGVKDGTCTPGDSDVEADFDVVVQ